jgi:hypothetical protein
MPLRSDRARIVTAAVLLGSALAGCSDIYYDRRETVSFAAGDASASAQATQIINPWPAASADRSHTSNGAVVAGAVERYRTCQVIQPKPTASQNTYNSNGDSTQVPQSQLGCTPAAAGVANTPGAATVK